MTHLHHTAQLWPLPKEPWLFIILHPVSTDLALWVGCIWLYFKVSALLFTSANFIPKWKWLTLPLCLSSSSVSCSSCLQQLRGSGYNSVESCIALHMVKSFRFDHLDCRSHNLYNNWILIIIMWLQVEKGWNVIQTSKNVRLVRTWARWPPLISHTAYSHLFNFCIIPQTGGSVFSQIYSIRRNSMTS